MNDAVKQPIPDDRNDLPSLQEAIKIAQAYSKFLGDGPPIIADAALLPYPKATIKRALLVYEQHLQDLANMHTALAPERLEEIDKRLKSTGFISVALNSYTEH